MRIRQKTCVDRIALAAPAPPLPFAIVIEYSAPVAALIPANATPNQIKNIYKLIPPGSFNSPELVHRWQNGSGLVACLPSWATEQLRRVPCLPPKETIRLAFL